MDWPEAARQGELWAAGLNVVALGVLVLTRRHWRAERSQASPTTSRPRHGWRELAFFAGLAVIVIFAGALRWKVAHHSLWWDEVWQARNASVGDWKPDKRNPGELKFVPTTWAQTLWNYRKPTNHPPMAVASKVCHEVWRRATGAKPGEFNEFVLRLPGLVASLAAVALIAVLLRAWGLPGGGLIAALFLAIHPWHIRYGIDGRGYTFLVPLTILGLWAVWRACGPARDQCSPRALWWWVFGITQGLILWCHLLSVWVCAGLAAAGLWWIWRQNTGAARRRKLARFLAVQAVGGMLFLQLFTPNLLQAAAWGEKNQDGTLLNGLYLLTTLSHVASGRPAADPSAHSSSYSLPNYLGPPQEYAVDVITALVCAGLLLTLLFRRTLAVATTSLLISCVVFLVFIALTKFYFYHRFILSVIVPVALLVGSGIALSGGWAISAFSRGSVRVKLGLVAGVLVGLVLLAPYRHAVLPMIVVLRQTPLTPLRETATALRDARDRGAAVFGYGFGAEALQYYLPELRYERDSPARPALEAALHEAHTAGKPLVVAVGYEELNRQNVPDGFALLDDPAVFEEVSKRDGCEPQFTYRVLRSVMSPPPR